VKSTGAGVVAAKPTYFFLERYAAAYVAEWDSFVTALEAKTPMAATLEDGVASLAMAEAATRSMQTGQPVRLAEILA
jgi:myo-inositol 2-dehydrogenase/D-chiro-inositol 1-dehydrogenase